MNISRLIAAFAALLLASLLPSAAEAARHALVVGINDYDVEAYRTAGRTARDAVEVARVLNGAASYDSVVVIPSNADRRTYRQKLSEFLANVERGDFVLFFFSGHGIEKYDDNWLLLSEYPEVPETDEVLEKDQLAQNAISVKELLKDLRRTGAASVILVINACRDGGPDNSLNVSADGNIDLGMQHIKALPTNTAILYASSSGKVAHVCRPDEDCKDETQGLTVFTRRFAEQLSRRGLSIEDLYRNVGAAVEADLAPFRVEQTAALYIDGFRFGDRDLVVLGPLGEKPLPEVEDRGTPPQLDKVLELGTFEDWNAWLFTDANGFMCYISSAPKSSDSAGLDRKPFLLVIHRSGLGTTNEVQTLAGYRFSTSNADVTASIDDRTYPMVTEDAAAWLASAGDEPGFVAAMKRGTQLVVRGTSESGARTSDTYSLRGVTAAMAVIDRACP